MRIKALLFFSLVYTCSVAAQDADSLQRWGMAVSMSPGQVLVVDEYQRKWQKGKSNFSIDMAVQHVSLPSDSDAFASDYGYPTLSGGLKYSFNHGVTMHKSPDPAWGLAEEVDYDTRLGNTVSAYASFARPILRTNKWEFDYSLSMGVGYSHHKYDRWKSVDNELIGSRFLVFFGAGTHLTWRFADNWGVKLGLDYWHLSNGALNRPNKGANFWGPSLGLTYIPYYNKIIERGPRLFRPSFIKYWYLDLAVGVGGKALNEEWMLTQFGTPPGGENYRTDDFDIYLAYSLQVDMMCRYARRWASGVGVDVFYGSYASRVERIDERQGMHLKHSPWSVGVSAKHQVFYHQFSLAMSLGYYLYREMGMNASKIEKPYYERIGLQYHFPNMGGLTVGAFVKAHLTKADLTEIIFALPFRIGSGRML